MSQTFEGDIDITVDVAGHEIEVRNIPYELTVKTDPGVRTCHNGDPGVPPSSTLTAVLSIDDEDLLEAIEMSYHEQVGRHLIGRKITAKKTRENTVRKIEERGW